MPLSRRPKLCKKSKTAKHSRKFDTFRKKIWTIPLPLLKKAVQHPKVFYYNACFIVSFITIILMLAILKSFVFYETRRVLKEPLGELARLIKNDIKLF